jgi:tetratricopeptide (TPR) repeat protein/DNA-binding SARP family transcriptional activator
MLGILGSTALLLDSGPDDTWGKPRERAMLATLLVHANEMVPVEKLVRWVWPKDKPAPLQPGPTFETYVARIRRTLARLPSPPGLRVEDGGYRLVIDRSRLDLHQFRAILTAAREQAGRDAGRAFELVESALWLWRGLPLADLVTEPARAWRERVLRDDWLAAHRIRVRALIDLGRQDEALTSLDDLQADYPDELGLAQLRLTALHHRRRFAEATAYFLTVWHGLRAAGDEHAAHVLDQHRTALAETHPAPDLPEPTLVPRQLPTDVPDFVGRRAELAAMDSVEPSDVLVLDGPGGVGKTALAVHWAHRVRGRFPDGDLFVNLRGFSSQSQVDPAAVVDDLLVALGQRPEPKLSRAQRERLLNVLVADRRILVVLDNARDSDQVRRLVELLPSCLVVVTSRRRLSLTSTARVRRVPVRPMSVDAAAILLSLRAHDMIPDAARLSTVCGGLPLLLNVLAGQLTGKASANLGDFVTRLDRRRLLAAVGQGGVPVRRGESCLTWSYQALAVPERRLFRLLALHPGEDISAEAAYACDGRTPSETIRSLMCLVAAHLLEPSDEFDRFSRHDVLAEFAARCLERDERADDRHAAWLRLLDFFAASAANAARMVCGYSTTHDQVPDQAIVFSDADDAAVWFERERWTLSAMIRHARDTGCHDHVARLADPVAALLERFGSAIQSGTVRALAVDSAHATGETAVEAGTLRQLGVAHLAVEDHDAARKCLEAAARLAPADDLHGGSVALLDQMGQLALLRGDSAEALTLYRRALALAERVDDLAGLCWLHCRIGQTLRIAEQVDDALAHLRQARATARRLGERAAEAASLAEIGGIHRDLGDCSAALAYCEEALAIAETVPDLTAAALICVTLSTIGSQSRRFDEAVIYSRRGVELLRGTQDLATQARVVAAHGDALYHSGESHQAVLMWQQAADLYDHAGFPVLAMRLRDKMDDRLIRGSAPPARTELAVDSSFRDEPGQVVGEFVVRATDERGKLPNR